MTIKNLWSVPVLRTSAVDYGFEREYLLKKIKDTKANSYNFANEQQNTTINGFQTDIDVLKDGMISSRMYDLFENHTRQIWIEMTANSTEIPQNAEFRYKTWIVNYECGAYQNLHFHKTSLITGIWFLDVQDQDQNAGELHLQNPNVPSFTLGFYNEVLKIQPRENELIVLPAWLAHNVTPVSASRTVLVWDVLPA